MQMKLKTFKRNSLDIPY